MNVGHAYADAIIENVKVLLVGFRDPYWASAFPVPNIYHASS